MEFMPRFMNDPNMGYSDMLSLRMHKYIYIYRERERERERERD